MNITQSLTRQSIAWIALLLLAASTSLPALAESESHEDEAHDDGHIELTEAQIDHANISLEKARSGSLVETLRVYGTVVPNPETSQHVSARFDGQIYSINKSIGDTVKRGETLATVESNESMQRYPLSASMSGVVTQRQANAGEQTNGRALMRIDDLSTVWAELKVFPRDLEKVSVGQTVRILDKRGRLLSEADITYIAPLAGDQSRAIKIRVPLNNQQGNLIPGSFVIGEIVIAETNSPLLVRKSALQLVEDQSVVFVKGHDGFEPREVKLGRSDKSYVEVLSGLEAGETYVAGNSFVLKSELGKEDAEHGH
tara:strand:+ start:2235 stop:3173 length:939 start_codon:yes stop_codon:yes gene_type:complete